MSRALLLAGSPRTSSTSQVVGEYLLKALEQRGWETESHSIYPALKSDGPWQEISHAAAEADVLILSTPLYVDSFPAGVIQALERLAEERRSRPAEKSQRMMALVNSGFPEPVQIRTALSIAARFARETGMEWAGGIAIGSGGSIDGKPLEEFGKMVHHIETGLNQTAEALTNGENIPEDAADLSIHLPLPKRLIIPVANLFWWFLARPHQAHRRLRDRPYLHNG